MNKKEKQFDDLIEEATLNEIPGKTTAQKIERIGRVFFASSEQTDVYRRMYLDSLDEVLERMKSLESRLVYILKSGGSR